MPVIKIKPMDYMSRYCDEHYAYINLQVITYTQIILPFN